MKKLNISSHQRRSTRTFPGPGVFSFIVYFFLTIGYDRDMKQVLFNEKRTIWHYAHFSYNYAYNGHEYI